MSGLNRRERRNCEIRKRRVGERYTTKVLVQVSEQGLYYIGVTAKLTTRIQTDARTFSVPVVVGTPPAEQKPAAAAAASAAAGSEALKTMPAVETTK